MDPKTVVLILALNLMVIGGLLAMIGRRMADPAGMRGFATGSIVFGLAYLLRLVQGHSETGVFSVVADAGMVFATLSYATGLRQFGGLSPLSWQAVWAWLAAFAAKTARRTLAGSARGAVQTGARRGGSG